jgi:hypothetical protein
MRDLAGPSRHALLLEAKPASIDAGRVVFEIPSHLPFHLERLKTDEELHNLLAQASTEAVGASVGVEFRTESDATAPPPPRPEPTRAPDKDDLEEDEGDIDPASLVIDMLDGEMLD